MTCFFLYRVKMQTCSFHTKFTEICYLVEFPGIAIKKAPGHYYAQVR